MHDTALNAGTCSNISHRRWQSRKFQIKQQVDDLDSCSQIIKKLPTLKPQQPRLLSVALIVVLTSSLWNLFSFCVELNNLFLCVCVFAVCDALVRKGILLYESLWWWLCKFHLFSSLLPVIAQVPASHLACASPHLLFLSFSCCLPPFPLLQMYIFRPACLSLYSPGFH